MYEDIINLISKVIASKLNALSGERNNPSYNIDDSGDLINTLKEDVNKLRSCRIELENIFYYK